MVGPGKPKLMLWNVKSIGSNKKQKKLCRFIKNQNSSLIVLTETWRNIDALEKFVRRFGPSWKVISTEYEEMYRGAAIIYDPKVFMLDSTTVLSCKSEGRFVGGKFTHVQSGTDIDIMGIYSPSDTDPNKLAFYTDLFEVWSPSPSHKILLGDFNMVLDETRDSRNSTAHSTGALLSVVSDGLASLSLHEPVDDTSLSTMTWTQAGSDIQRRLDRIYLTPELLDLSSPSRALVDPHHSDHAPVQITLDLASLLPSQVEAGPLPSICT